jgi:hypothetical protein
MKNTRKIENKLKPLNILLPNTLLSFYTLVVCHTFGFSTLTFFLLYFSMIGFISTKESDDEMRKRIKTARRRERFAVLHQRAIVELTNKREEYLVLLDLKMAELENLRLDKARERGEIAFRQDTVKLAQGVVDITKLLADSTVHPWQKRRIRKLYKIGDQF